MAQPNREHIKAIEENHSLRCTAQVDDGSAYFINTVGPPQILLRLTKGKIAKLAALIPPLSCR